MKNQARHILTAFAVLLSLSFADPAAAQMRTPGSQAWATAWSAPMAAAAPDSYSGPNWSREGFLNHSVRQIVRTTGGGSSVRVRLSNRFGTQPLRITGATVARSTEGAAVQTGSVRPLSFGHRSSTLISVGRELTSDALQFRTSPLERLTVTLYFAGETGPSTFHPEANASSYRASGDHRGDTSGTAFTTQEPTASWYYLTGVEVSGPAQRGRGTVVAFGDSITDGVSGTRDGFDRYPDVLAERLVAGGRPLTVVNAGIVGNRVLNDSACFGEKASSRFRRDVLDQVGVRTVIVLEGVNDLGFSESPANPCTDPNPAVDAAELISGHRRLIRAAHDRGIRIIGATITPYKDNVYGNWSARGEAVRNEVNHWIRTSGEYDAFADFDRALSDSDGRLRTEYNGGDALHPNPVGLAMMAHTIDLNTL
ncbi:SGNH/GDSL hydrolase family protein [Streptomyces sp. ISL-66]|uniref:SGNH/GDSL hydrolase family protein n=1 Tax=Streptomyces sp. ISL-66 TaxID=2819186 RepID=UPI001BEB83D8|nr:SGNH/GDSL hydrolase family protein [Streptomyces sp. ISL-66]MBT2472151.1 SGNH/GDSL hydrolase family protein [Streptomyces sp. ISL-66]